MAVRPRIGLFVWLLLCLSVLLGAKPSSAEPRKLSDYELDTIRIALQQVKGTEDLEAEGKLIESIEVVPLEVFEPRDPAPGFLNWFHVTTRPYIIEREVLQLEGQAFSRRLADETERNLRSFIQLSLVLVVTAKGSTPDRVRVLVVTKDVWSLRVGWDPRIVNGKLDSLALRPTEQNLLGTAQVVFANVNLSTHTYTLGGGITIPRIAGSRIRAAASAGAIFNCGTGNLEGSNVQFSYGQPLYSTAAKWAWQTSVSAGTAVVRPLDVGGEWICRGRGEQLRYFDLNTGRVARQARSTDGHLGVALPYRYSSSVLTGTSIITRSFNRVNKIDLSFGAEAVRSSAHLDRRGLAAEASFVTYRVNEVDAGFSVNPEPRPRSEDAAAEVEQALEIYKDAFAPTETRISPFIQLQAYKASFKQLINLDTLGLQEDYRLGHSVALKLYPALRAVGSTRDLLGSFASLSYTWPVQRGLVSARVTSKVELSRHLEHNGQLELGLKLVTPEVGFGRFVYDVDFANRYLDYSNGYDSLGSTYRLRGYRPGAFLGTNSVISNLEFRTRPLQIFSILIGAAVFYDAGDAFQAFERISLKHAAGGGLRFLFPSLDRDVFRIDVGAPLNPDVAGAEVSVFAGFYQAF